MNYDPQQVPGEDPQGPQFKSFPRSATVDRNGAASFACEVDRPPKSVIWMKDGKELREVPMKTRLTADKTRKVISQKCFQVTIYPYYAISILHS